MYSAAPIDGSLEPLCLNMGNFRRPVSAETAPHYAHASAVDVRSLFEIVERGRKCAFRLGFARQERILAGAGNIDRKGGQAKAVKCLAGASAIFLPSIHTTPVEHYRRLGETSWNLNIADDRFAFEGDLHALHRRVEVSRSLHKVA
jgi:hypothetical protein